MGSRGAKDTGNRLRSDPVRSFGFLGHETVVDQLLPKAVKSANRSNSVNLNDLHCRLFSQGIHLSVATTAEVSVKPGAILTFH